MQNSEEDQRQNKAPFNRHSVKYLDVVSREVLSTNNTEEIGTDTADIYVDLLQVIFSWTATENLII